MSMERHIVKSDAAVFRKFKSIGTSGAVLNKLGNKDRVMILEHRNATIAASAKDILEYNLTFHQPYQFDPSALTYHYPLSKWRLIEGDSQWLEKLYADFNWKLN